jgi:hypothetical protein
LKIATGSHPLLSDLKATLEAAEAFVAKASAVKIDKHLSPEGRAAKTEKLIRSTLRDLRDLVQPVDAKRAELATIVSKIRPTSFDGTDVAAALLRGEMRAHLRNMSIGDKAALLMGDKADPSWVDAALEGPAVLSLVDAGMYEQVREQRLETLFAAESAQAEALGDEIAEADAILTLAKQDIATASGLQPYEFTKLVEEVDSKRDAVWLRKERNERGESVVIVVPIAGGPARLATADEQRDGQYFNSLAEYRASRAA